MSAPDGTISRAATADIGQDYGALVAEGTLLLQQMSGTVWTNYNYSDPGVTIFEQLCYALTELSYRADFPVQDLLGAEGSGQVSLLRQGLYPARAIMTGSAVTPDDLRRLVIDRVPEVDNIWFTPLPAAEAGGNSGLYRIEVLARPDHCSCPPPDNTALRTRVLDCYAAHRALCEDAYECRILQPLAAYVGADVQLAEGSDPDLVLAQLQFATGMLVTPVPLRRSLAQQLAADLPTSAIFDGPPMLHGLIDAGQLGPRPHQLALDDVWDAMAEVAGVLSVDALALQAGDDPHLYRPGQYYDLPDGRVLQLQAGGGTAGLALRLFAGGLVCRTNPARVRRLLERAWAEQRRTYPLPAEYREHYRPPAGRGADLAAYSSVQTQFPAVYGIGAQGLPGQADPMRRAQARQLKGYLMPFDQLMADFFSQLGFVRELYSIQAGGERTYAWQTLEHLVPDWEPLLQPDYREGMAALVAAHDPVAARQSAVLDAKRALLTQMVPATRERGRGFDYRRGAGARNIAGMEIRCRIELAVAGASAAAVTEAVGDAAEQPLYIVEWLLLRYALQGEEPAQAEDMGFRISAVLPRRRHGDDDDGADDEGWRTRVRTIVRANTPAHIIVDTLFLDRRRMQHFIGLYEEWTRALRNGAPERRREASRKLAHFLRPHAAQAVPEQPPIVAAEAAPPPAQTEQPAAPARPAAAPEVALPDLPHLPGAPAPAVAGANGVHLHQTMDTALIKAFAAQGFTFVLRDLGTWIGPGGDALDHAEATAILKAGLALMPVQLLQSTSWAAGASQGRRDGERALAEARAVGIAAGAALWLHAGQVMPGQRAPQLAAYCIAWRDSVRAAGYQCGLYLPRVAPADAPLFAGLGFDCYWRQQDCRTSVTGPGTCLFRTGGNPRTLNGVRCDWHYIEAADGRPLPHWVRPLPAPAG